MTGRRRLLAIVGIVAVLVLTPLAIAATNQAVVSSNTNDSDFNNAYTLDDVEVVGSGQPANVILGEDTATYNVVDDSGDGATDSSQSFIGDDSADGKFEAEAKIVPTSTGRIENLTVDIDSVTGTNYDPAVDIYIVAENPDGDYTDGTKIVDAWNPAWSTGEQTVELDSEFLVSSGENYSIAFDTTNTDTDSTSDFLSIKTDTSFTSTWFTVDVGGGGVTNYNEGADLTIGTYQKKPNGTYIGDNHTADQAVLNKGFVNLTLSNATAYVTWQEDNDDDGSWTDITTSSTDTFTSDGNYTINFELPGGGGGGTVNTNAKYENVRVNVTFENGSGTTTAKLHDEGVLFTNHDPTVDNATATPTGDVTQRKLTFDIQANDSEFSAGIGESVSAQLYVDNTQVGSDTLASNGTASVTHTLSTGGDKNYYWALDDSFSGTGTSDTFSLSSPGTLYIRNESNASELVKPVEVEVRWYGSNRVFTNTTTDGKVNMSGLPITDFIVSINASDGWYGRTVYIDNLFEQNSVYLLNKSKPAIVSRFNLEDTSGEFTTRSRFTLYRPINKSGVVKYRRIISDRFGVEGITATLKEDERYRAEITSETGQTVDLGPYRADTSETVTVQPGAPTIDIDDEGSGWQLGAEQTESKFIATYNDTANETTYLKIWVHERNNKSNILGTNRTFSDPVKDVTAQYVFSGDENETAWVAEFEFTKNGTDYYKSVFPGRAGVSDVPGMLPGNWALVVGVLTMFIFAGVFSILNRAIGAVLIPVVGAMMYWLGFLPGAASAASIVIALTVGVLYSIYISGGP